MRTNRLLAALATLVLLPVLAVLAGWGGDEPPKPIAGLIHARELLVAVDNAELCHWQRHRRYGNVVDLDETLDALDRDHLTGTLMTSAVENGLQLEIQVSASGRSYLQRITGEGVDTYVERRALDFVDYGDDGWRRLGSRCRT